MVYYSEGIPDTINKGKRPIKQNLEENSNKFLESSPPKITQNALFCLNNEVCDNMHKMLQDREAY